MNRRSFLSGLGALVAAPAIVQASGLMPVKMFDPFYTRYLLGYEIGSDEFMVRIDRAQFPLRTEFKPNVGLRTLTEREAFSLVAPGFAKHMKSIVATMRPAPLQQLLVEFPVPHEKVANFDASGRLLFGTDRVQLAA